LCRQLVNIDAGPTLILYDRGLIQLNEYLAQP